MVLRGNSELNSEMVQELFVGFQLHQELNKTGYLPTYFPLRGTSADAPAVELKPCGCAELGADPEEALLAKLLGLRDLRGATDLATPHTFAKP